MAKMRCSCCGKSEGDTTFYIGRKKCAPCTKEQLRNRYHTDEEHRTNKIEYARFMNPFRDRSLKGAV